MNRAQTALSENGMFENNRVEEVPAMDGRRGALGLRALRWRDVSFIFTDALCRGTATLGWNSLWKDRPNPFHAKVGGVSSAVHRRDLLDHAVLEEPTTRTGPNSSTGNCRDPRASILSLQRRVRRWNLGLTGMN